jgi:hypothetical protein
MIAAGVPAGATIPYHWSASNPASSFSPLSATVGNCGRLASRCGLETASARMRPLFTNGSTAGAPVKIACTWPAIRSVTAGEVPRYGTCTMNVCVRSFRYSIARCAALPLPPDA